MCLNTLIHKPEEYALVVAYMCILKHKSQTVLVREEEGQVIYYFLTEKFDMSFLKHLGLVTLKNVVFK